MIIERHGHDMEFGAWIANHSVTEHSNERKIGNSEREVICGYVLLGTFPMRLKFAAHNPFDQFPDPGTVARSYHDLGST